MFKKKLVKRIAQNYIMDVIEEPDLWYPVSVDLFATMTKCTIGGAIVGSVLTAGAALYFYKNHHAGVCSV